MSLRQKLRRLSVYGDVWTRVLEWGAKNCPTWLEPVLLGVYSTVIWAVCAPPRRAIASNLRAIHPGWSGLKASLGALRVIYNYGSSLADATRATAGEDVIDWDIDGLENFKALSASEGGAIVLTAHMGNYDLAAPVFAGRFGRRLNAVRAPERQKELQEHYEKMRSDSESEAFAVRYNEDGAMLGVELAKLLGDGELVALQGDRVLFEVAPVEGEMFGRKVRLPKGPFALAMASRAQVWPLFIIREGWRRYRIRVGKSFSIKGKRGERDAAMAEGVKQWCAELETVAGRWWYQWFVLEEIFGEASGEHRGARPIEESEPAIRGAQRGNKRFVFTIMTTAVIAALGLSIWWLWGSARVLLAPLAAFALLNVAGLIGAAIKAIRAPRS